MWFQKKGSGVPNKVLSRTGYLGESGEKRAYHDRSAVRCTPAQGTSSHAPPRLQLPISVPGLPQRSGREAKGRLSLSDSPQAILIGPCGAGFPCPVPLPTLSTTPFPRPSARHSRPCHPSSSSQLTVLAGDLVIGQQQMPTAKICTLGLLGRRGHRRERRCEVWCVRSGTAVSTAPWSCQPRPIQPRRKSVRGSRDPRAAVAGSS